jgi:hypothetical protein
VLVKYVGWGGMPQPFADWGVPREWQGVRAEMDSLLTPEEFKSARASTPNAHYTSPLVIQKIWDAVRRLGIRDNSSFLEPAMGVGHFYGLMPEDLAEGSRRTGIELDSLSGRIAKLLYPETDIHVAGFEQVRLPGNFFDAAVSNVPFGNYAIHDPAFKRNPVVTHSIHDYFFAKALDKVRPGGLVAFITSNFTMDKRDGAVRKYLADHADLLGAIRLPNTAFKGNAGTEVTTDIIFLRKRAPGEKSQGDPWTKLAEIQGNAERPDGSIGKTPMEVNEYYAAHPEMMLGEMGLTGTMYRDKSSALTGELTPEKLDGPLQSYLRTQSTPGKRLPRNPARRPSRTPRPSKTAPMHSTRISNSSSGTETGSSLPTILLGRYRASKECSRSGTPCGKSFGLRFKTRPKLRSNRPSAT